MQLHLDGCFNAKHLKAAGVREDEDVHDGRVPASIFMTDAERDRRDGHIATDLKLKPTTCRSCNNFTADPKESKCVVPFPVPVVHAFRGRAASRSP